MAKESILGVEGIDVVNYFNSMEEPSIRDDNQESPQDSLQEPLEEVKEKQIPKEPDLELEEKQESEETEIAKEEVDEVAEGKEETSAKENNIYTELSAELGYDIEGDYTDDVPGLAKAIKSVANTMLTDNLKDVFETYPDVMKYMQYRINGGDPDEYMLQEDKVFNDNINEDDEERQKEVLTYLFKGEGYTEDEIEEKLEDYADSDLLYKEAKRAVRRIKAKQIAEQDNRKAMLLKQQEERTALEEETRKKQTEEITNLINKGTIKNVKLSDREQKAFLGWMFNPINKEGKTQRQMDIEKADTETALAIEYLMYKKLDFRALVDSSVRTNQTRSIKEQLNNNEKRMVSNPKGFSKRPILPSVKEIFGT